MKKLFILVVIIITGIFQDTHCMLFKNRLTGKPTCSKMQKCKYIKRKNVKQKSSQNKTDTDNSGVEWPFENSSTAQENPTASPLEIELNDKLSKINLMEDSLAL